jgi:hypothetical protein
MFMGAVATRPTATVKSKMRAKCDDCITLAIRGGVEDVALAARKEKGSEARKWQSLFLWAI